LAHFSSSWFSLGLVAAGMLPKEALGNRRRLYLVVVVAVAVFYVNIEIFHILLRPYEKYENYGCRVVLSFIFRSSSFCVFLLACAQPHPASLGPWA